MSEATGCEYREHKGVLQCKKLCDPGQTMCPHHLLLTQAKAGQRKPIARVESRASNTPRAYQE